MEKSIAVHEPMMVNEEDMDFRIPGLPHSVVQTRKYQRSTIVSENWEPPRSTCSSKRLKQNQSFNPSVQNQNKWFGMLETSSCVNYSRRNPWRSAKYVYHTGTLVSLIARAGTSCIKKEGRISKFINSVPGVRHQKGRQYGKKLGDKEYHDANQLKKKQQEEVFPRNPWSIRTRSRIPSSNDWK